MKVFTTRKFAHCVTNNDLLSLHLVVYTNRLMHACQVFHMYISISNMQFLTFLKLEVFIRGTKGIFVYEFL